MILFSNVASEGFVRRILNMPFPLTLEGFHLFKMFLYIMDNFFVESCAYVQPCLKTLSQCQIFQP